MAVSTGIIGVFANGLVAIAANPSPAPSQVQSAIGDEVVSAVVVSPAYERTGRVFVSSRPTIGCTQDCAHLWITNDRGITWRRAAAKGWPGGSLTVGVDPKGSEVLFGDAEITRSDDLGETFTPLGVSGEVTPTPTFGVDGALAVAGSSQPDYLLRNNERAPVVGSDGRLFDYRFMMSSRFPGEGRFPSALLSGTDRVTRLPVIQRCSSSLRCSGSVSLPGSTLSTAPVTLRASSTYDTDGTVFADTSRGIYKSTDGGANFKLLVPLATKGASVTATPALAVAPGYQERGPIQTIMVAILQAVTSGQAGHLRAVGGIYRSDDGGASWRNTSDRTPLDGGASAVAIAPDGRVFGAFLAGTTGHSGLLCASARGDWAAVCPKPGSIGTEFGGSSSAASTSWYGWLVLIAVVAAVGLIAWRKRNRPQAWGFGSRAQ